MPNIAIMFLGFGWWSLVACANGHACVVIAWACNATVVTTLLDLAVRTGGAGSDSLPNDVAVVAETELLAAVADDGAILCAGS